ncbi:MAG: hypothetical protein KAJ18_01640 [Candidatus Omnitrophica bacterium]|nr:hypothetical protein [Candidatus Omnitrophota bacterium]
MKKMIDVHRDEIVAGQGEVVLESDASGACLVIVARDAIKKIGGLAHAMFYSSFAERRKSSVVLRNASEAIDEMIENMSLIGADRDNIEVSLITGENVLHESNDTEYTRNLNFAADILRQKHVKFRENSVQDVGGAHVALDVESGEILYKQESSPF